VHVSRLSTMGEMATGLAHELNQPLSAIANYANGCTRRLQSSGRGKEDLIHALGQINSQATRAAEIIRRLRSMVGKQPPVRSVADINDLVREVCSFVEFDAKKSQVKIEQALSLESLKIKVDVVQIEQVLLNLIRNALDALLEVPEPGRRLVVRTEHMAENSIPRRLCRIRYRRRGSRPSVRALFLHQGGGYGNGTGDQPDYCGRSQW